MGEQTHILFVVPPSGGLETRNSTKNRLKAELRTASRPIYAKAIYSNGCQTVEWLPADYRHGTRHFDLFIVQLQPDSSGTINFEVLLPDPFYLRFQHFILHCTITSSCGPILPSSQETEPGCGLGLWHEHRRHGQAKTPALDASVGRSPVGYSTTSTCICWLLPSISKVVTYVPGASPAVKVAVRRPVGTPETGASASTDGPPATV